MEPFKEIRHSAEDLFGRTTDYIEARWNMIVLDASDKAADYLSSFVTGLIVATIGGFAVLFGSMALGFWIGEKIGSTAAGFGWIAAGYLVITLLLFVVRDKFIKFPVLNALIKKFYYTKSDE
ncbi:MAG: hypothetical protein QM669_11995 [Siphonobacter sp.]